MGIPKKIIINSLTIIILIVAGYYFHIVPLLGYGLETIPGDFGDGRFVNYGLEHCYLFFTRQVEFFWSAGFYYPFKNTFAISDNMLGTAPIYSVFRVLKYDRETAYQFWIVVLFIFNFISSTFIFYKITGDLSIAAIGGFIFTFNISMFGQYYHLQMLPRFPVPIAIYFSIEFIKTKKIKYYTIFIFAVVYQFYCGIYLGFFLLLALLLIFLISLIIDYKSYIHVLKNYKYLLKLFLISFSAIVLMLILMLPYYEWSKQLGSRQFFEVKDSIPTINSYLFSINGTLIWHWLENTYKFSSIWWDHLLFPGGIALISFFSTLLLFRKIYTETYKYYLFGFLLLFVFTLNIYEFTFYKIIFILPGFNSIRSLGRVINIEVFFFAFFVVIMLQYISLRIKYKYIFLGFVLIITLLDQAIIEKPYPTYNKIEAQNRIARLVEKAKSITNEKCFAYCPVTKTEPVYFYHIDAMLLSQKIKLPTVNGYSATCPDYICNFITTLDTTTLYQWITLNNIPKDKIFIIK